MMKDEKNLLQGNAKKKGLFGSLGSAFHMFQGKDETVKEKAPVQAVQPAASDEPVVIVADDQEGLLQPVARPSGAAVAVVGKVTILELEDMDDDGVNRLASDITQFWLDAGGSIQAISPTEATEGSVQIQLSTGGQVEAGKNMRTLFGMIGRAPVEHYFFGTPIASETAQNNDVFVEELAEQERRAAQEHKNKELEALKRRMVQEQNNLAVETAVQAPAEAEVTQDEEPIDAKLNYRVSSDKMLFSILASAPQYGGADVTLEQVKRYMEDMEIRYGAIDSAIQDLVENKRYEVWTDVAVGTQPVHGTNGTVEELFPRQIKLELKEKADGSIDFKGITTVQTIDKGTPICNITLPTPGEDGKTVYGSVLKGRNGLAAVVPAGENTVLSGEKTQLLAGTDGSLVFRGGKFHVEPVLRLDNVDASTGNIDFNGDIVVRGRVQEGYTVRCKGNIKVEGMVEGADIKAGGSILLVHGINGMGKGILVAKKEITAKFIESCTVSAGGKIKAETVVNSTLETDEGLEISGGKGRIVGGSITSFGSIKARRVGARSAVPTVITLGVTPSIIKQKNDIALKVDAMAKELNDMNKNLAFLEKQQADRQITPAHRTLLQQLRLQLPVQKMKFTHLKKTLEELEAKIDSQHSAQLVGQKIYPPTKINIGRSSLTTWDIHENARVYMNSEGEIVIGMA